MPITPQTSEEFSQLEILSLHGGYINCGLPTDPDFRAPRTFTPGERFIACYQLIEVCQGRIEPRSIEFKPTALCINGGYGEWQIHDIRVDARSQLDGDEFSSATFSPRRNRHNQEMLAIVSGFDTIRDSFEIEVSFLGGGEADRAPFYAALMGFKVKPNLAVTAYSGSLRFRGLEGQLVSAACDGPSRVLPAESGWFVAQPDRMIHPTRLAIDRHSQDWLVADIHVNGKSQFKQGGLIPGEAFHPDTLDCFATFNVVPPGGSFAIKACYNGSNPQGGRFGAVVHGHLLDELKHRLD